MLGRTPVFMRGNSCIPLNLKGGKLFSDVGNGMDGYAELTFFVSGKGSYTFEDDLGNLIELEWDETSYKEVKNSKGTSYRIEHIGRKI